MKISELKSLVLDGRTLNRGQAMNLWETDADELFSAADEIRRKMCGNSFELCTITNGKSGSCSENCAYCAQSVSCHSSNPNYGLLSKEKIFANAMQSERAGVLRFSVVTSGRALPQEDLDKLYETYRQLKADTKLFLCASHGLLSLEQLLELHSAGVTRYHNNLETSRRYFSEICTTHTYDEKIQTIRWAQKAGLEVCSGGIIGLGETRGDRVDLAITLRELDIRSVPLNVLNPIPGTPMENRTPLTRLEVQKTIAVFRFLLPQAAIRLAGGRNLLEDLGEGCFKAGANAAITGDMLTTSGISVQTDRELIGELGYEVKRL
ncbi:MAG: biotin synthase BioB [Clostridiales bacterium]|jgi:biotin synthase|nr:biotin synthase BioB [Clostridiales bacterium]